ncbi:MAG: helix-hairpin-helix domain-containing protein, partial [Planctomycetaceae bacterium]
MHNAEVARVFDRLADLLEIQGANPFRVRAYRNASRILEGLTEPLADIVADPDRALDDLPGIGEDLAEKIETILATGRLPQLDELQQQIPPGVVEMLGLPGLGPKKVAALAKELSITSLADLKTAAEAGKVAQLKGFGKKTEQTILENIDRVVESGKRFSIAVAKEQAQDIVDDLLALESVTQAAVAGSCRRRKETVGDLDVLAVAADSTAAMDHLAGHRLVEKVLARGETKQRVRLVSGIELDLRVVPQESYGAALVYFTGSKEHNIVIRRRAQDRGLKINEYGVFRGEKQVAGKSEEDVYESVGLVWIPPELREERGEIERAE